MRIKAQKAAGVGVEMSFILAKTLKVFLASSSLPFRGKF